MLKILQKDNDVVGADIYRDDNVAIPNAFRTTLHHEINPNKLGTNNQVTVKCLVPVVQTVDGVMSSKNQFFASFKFASLQHITNDVEREKCYNDIVAYITKPAVKAAILTGTLPAAPVVFV